MKNFYLFEAGATKTAVMYLKDGETHEITLPGFNPNIDNPSFRKALESEMEVVDQAEIMFYGSGLATAENKDVVREMFGSYSPAKLYVYDDIIGAARAAFKSNPGIICIMGTGGLAAYYDGRDIAKRRGGYGYLIDDLGGGFELGKKFLAAWLNGDLSEDIQAVLSKETGKGAREYLSQIYESKDLKLISGILPIMAELKNQEEVDLLVQDYFKLFISTNVLPLAQQNGLSTFSVVGSVATGFYSQLRAAAKHFDLQLEQCIQNPIQRLFEYHIC